MRIAMASDHAGRALKDEIKALLMAGGHEVTSARRPMTRPICRPGLGDGGHHDGIVLRGQRLAHTAAPVVVPGQFAHPFGQRAQQRRVGRPVAGFCWAADDFGQHRAVRGDHGLVGASGRERHLRVEVLRHRQEWDKSDTQTITISNELSARYQRRRRAVDR